MIFGGIFFGILFIGTAIKLVASDKTPMGIFVGCMCSFLGGFLLANGIMAI